ncbi:MAG: SGNH/GDSL hydrolase family protein [Polyangiaceae bacterium]|nr:SGNH/GDSL hydrolase family protein [Polyangiaceae bacterium]
MQRAVILATLLMIAPAGCAPSAGTPAGAPDDSTPPTDAAAEKDAAPAAVMASAAAAQSSSTPAASAKPETAKPEAPPLPKGTVVLHVGDSFVHSGLTQRLRELFAPYDVKYEVRAEHSTNSLDWAKRMPELVASTQPDFVIVTLGGNEIGSKHLDVQARAAERIVKAIGNRPCVWTTPPLWMEESGLFDAVAPKVAPCRFFETDAVVGKFIPRREDKIHPTKEGGAMWADALFAWTLRERTGPRWELQKGPESEIAPRGRRGPLPQ